MLFRSLHRFFRRRAFAGLRPLIRLKGRQRQDQVMPARLALPQCPQIREAPVVGGKQVVQQAQLRVAAVRQAFFTSLMVMRR